MAKRKVDVLEDSTNGIETSTGVGVVSKVASTDNAVVRFNGTTGEVQNSGVVIDDNDNVGIGVTPSNGWGAYSSASIELGSHASIYANTNGSSAVNLSTNVKSADTSINDYDTQYVYTGQGAASYSQYNGVHFWHTAPVGTAGSPITWNNAMTLGSSGNLLVGTTTDNGVGKLQVNGSITSKSSQWKYNDLNNACTVDENTIVDNNCLNIPVNDYGYVTIQVSTPFLYCMQTFVGMNKPARLFVRVMAGGGWSPWVEK